MKKWMVLGLALICLALFAACTREPVQESVEPDLPEESPEVIVTVIPEESEEAEERDIDPGLAEPPEVTITVIPGEGEETEEKGIDPGFTAPAPAGTGDGGMAVPAPDWDPDPDFDVSSDADQGESGTFVIIPEPVE